MPEAKRQSPLAAKLAAMPRRHDNDHPLWQGPSGEGPNGGITQSMLVWFLSCRERFRLKYVLGLEPHYKWDKSIGYGNMWHVCEEALAAGADPANTTDQYALAKHVEECCKKYPMQQDEIFKWAEVCRVQFPEYVKHWREHPDVQNRTPLMQEQVFDVPYSLPSGRTVRLRGKFDSVDLIDAECNCSADRTGSRRSTHDATCPAASGAKTGIYLQENKTKGDIDQLQVERQLKFDLQTMMYLIALERVRDVADSQADGWAWTYPVQGVRYNVVRRPLSGGLGSIRPHKAKTTKTKHVPAETEEDFYERLRRDYIAADPAYWFFRVRAEVSARDIQVFRDTCLDPLLENICVWYEQVTNRPFDTSWLIPSLNYRTPFGVWSALQEGGATEYDACLETGSEAGLRRTETLFTELTQ